MTSSAGEMQRRPSLLQMLDAAMASSEIVAQPMADDDIARTSLRIPRAILEEVAACAQANRMSLSVCINLLLDEYLHGQGRPGYSELAPGYPDYVLRKKQ